MKSNYQRALSYAFKCNSVLYRDLVHQAYIQNYNKDGTNLFDDKNIYYILKCIKYVWFTHIRNSKFESRGQKHSRQWFSIDEETFPISTNTPNPQQITESNEFVTEFHKRVDNYESRNFNGHDIGNQLKEYVKLKELGYSQAEISEQMGMSPQRINYYSGKIKTIAKQMFNPLRTSTVPISKRITRKTYETNEQYHEYIYDPDKGCDANEYYEIRVGPKGDYLLIREKGE